MICPSCFPWNLPLSLTQKTTVEGAVVPLVFEQWLAFHHHVVMHQAGKWGGELEQYTKELLAQTQERALS